MADTKEVAPHTLTALSKLLDKYQDQIRAALPRHMTAERMIRIALSAVSRTPLLAECTPLSLAASVVQASVLGLEPSTVLGEAYLVPFWNSKLKIALPNGGTKEGGYESTLIPGYQGLIKLARNSGKVSIFDTQVVYSNDEFDFEKGSTIFFRHKWPREGDRGYLQGAWAGYSLTDKSSNFEYWTIPQIEDHRDKYSQGAYKKSYGKYVLDDNGNKILTGAWADSPEWMYKKTVIRQTVKLMPKSVELATALNMDEMADVGMPSNFLELPPSSMTDDPDMNRPVEPEAKTSGPKRKSEAPPPPAGQQTPPAGEPGDPKKVKPSAEILTEIEGMLGTIGKGPWWTVMGDCSLEMLTQIKTHAEAEVVLGLMKAQVRKS